VERDRKDLKAEQDEENCILNLVNDFPNPIDALVRNPCRSAIQIEPAQCDGP